VNLSACSTKLAAATSLSMLLPFSASLGAALNGSKESLNVIMYRYLAEFDYIWIVCTFVSIHQPECLSCVFSACSFTDRTHPPTRRHTHARTHHDSTKLNKHVNLNARVQARKRTQAQCPRTGTHTHAHDRARSRMRTPPTPHSTFTSPQCASIAHTPARMLTTWGGSSQCTMDPGSHQLQVSGFR
jgi:hypothetical protein